MTFGEYATEVAVRTWILIINHKTDIIIWVSGFGVSLVFGHFAAGEFLKKLRAHMKIKKEVSKRCGDFNTIPPWLLGSVERLMFTFVVAFNLPGAAVAMMAWLAAKMAANWGSRVAANKNDGVETERLLQLRLSALLAGLVSMFFAMAGGLIIGYWALRSY